MVNSENKVFGILTVKNLRFGTFFYFFHALQHLERVYLNKRPNLGRASITALFSLYLSTAFAL